jgi:WD40 repeat protein
LNSEQTEVITVNYRGSSYEATVRVRETNEWQILDTLYINDYDFLSYLIPRFQPDGRAIVVSIGRSQKNITIWDIATSTALYTFSFDESPHIDISQDGSMLFLAAGTERWLYDITQPESPQQLSLPDPILPFSSARFSPEGQYLFLVEFDQPDHATQCLLRLWRLDLEQVVAQITHRDIALFTRYSVNIQLIDDGQALVLGEGEWSEQTQMTFWNFEHLLSEPYTVPFLTVPNNRSSLATDREGSIAVPTLGQGVQIWDDDGLDEVLGDNEWWTTVLYGPDASVLLSATQIGTVTAWSVPLGQELTTFAVTPWVINKMQFIENGTLLFIQASDGTLRLWGVPSSED